MASHDIRLRNIENIRNYFLNRSNVVTEVFQIDNDESLNVWNVGKSMSTVLKYIDDVFISTNVNTAKTDILKCFEYGIATCVHEMHFVFVDHNDNESKMCRYRSFVSEFERLKKRIVKERRIDNRKRIIAKYFGNIDESVMKYVIECIHRMKLSVFVSRCAVMES